MALTAESLFKLLLMKSFEVAAKQQQLRSINDTREISFILSDVMMNYYMILFTQLAFFTLWNTTGFL